jgi:chemotaxis response regulator CheB
MPREAIEADAVHEVAPLSKLREKALAASLKRREAAK